MGRFKEAVVTKFNKWAAKQEIARQRHSDLMFDLGQSPRFFDQWHAFGYWHDAVNNHFNRRVLNGIATMIEHPRAIKHVIFDLYSDKSYLPRPS